MIAKRITPKAIRAHQRTALLAVIGLATGCQTISFPSDRSSGARSHATVGVSSPRQKPSKAAPETAATTVEPVAYQVVDSNSDSNATNQAELSDLLADAAYQSDSIEEESGTSTVAGGNSTFDAQLSSDGMALSDFEALALGNNPSIQELAATTQKAAGYRTQVGLRPNPTIGYQAVQLADAGTDQHLAYVSQTIVTANKLELNRQVQDRAVRAQTLQYETRKLRVLTDVRMRFYDALAAQQRVRLTRTFQKVADKGLEIAEMRRAAQEGTQLDVVQARVQKNEIDLTLQQAEIAFAAAWRELVALTGVSSLQAKPLVGVLPGKKASLDWDNMVAGILQASPEYATARARVSQAKANLSRQNVQRVPNLLTQLAGGVDNATNSGAIYFQVGARMPLFNQNQGNISAANAELRRACKEVERIEKSIQARLAVLSKDYESALAAVKKYEGSIIPSAEEGLELAEATYRAGETSFVQILIARRTYYQAKLKLVTSKANLAKAQSRVDGYLLTGALDPVSDQSGSSNLRGQTFSQQ